jgi:hypothetical protein
MLASCYQSAARFFGSSEFCLTTARSTEARMLADRKAAPVSRYIAAWECDILRKDHW